MKTWIFKNYFTVILLTLFSTLTFAQLAVNNTMTPAQLVQNVLLGQGITVSNVTFTGVLSSTKGYQIGSFSSTGATQTQLGFSNGIFLTSGSTTNITGAVSQVATAYTSGTAGEMRKNIANSTLLSDMQTLIGGTTNWGNLAILEFDFIPTSDSVKFRYVFSSTEYADPSNAVNYNCSDVNDKMAFIISGPGFSGPFSNGGTNIALIPGTNLPVCINAINNGIVGSGGGAPNKTKCESANPSWTLGTPTDLFYGAMSGIAFNGNTKVMTARTKVTPCQTYHIRLLVTDVGDYTYDSGIFIEGGSFSSPGVTASSQIKDANGAPLTNNYITENCSKALLTFTVNPAPTSNYTINYTLGGNATNNTDYTIPASVTIPAGQTSTQLTITPTSDNLTEGDETITIQLLGQSTCSGTTPVQTPITITLKDELKITASKTSDPTCSLANAVNSDGVITLTATGGATPYTFSLDNGTTYVYNSSPISTLGNGTYNIKVKDKDGCIAADLTAINFNKSCSCVKPSITSTKTNPTTCNGTDGKITISGLTNGKTYALSYVKDGAAPTTSSITASGTTFDITTLGKGVYTKINVSNSGCTSNDEAQTLTDPSGITITSTKTDPTSCGGTDGKITISGLTSGKTYSLSYVKDGSSPTTSSFTASGSTYDITTLGKGVYTKINVSNSGCTSNDETQTLTDPSGITITSTKTDPTSCNGTDGKITISGLTNGKTYTLSYVKDGAAPTTSSITASATTFDITTLGKGVYTKINVSNSGCTSNDEAQTLTDPSGITLTTTKTDPTTCSGNDGKITISGLTNGKTYTLSYVKDGAAPTTSSITASGTTYDITTLGKGVYIKINVSNSGCTSNDETETLSDPNGITLTSTKTDPSSCGGTDGKITISGLTNGKTYTLSYVKDGAAPTTSSITSSGTTFDITTLGKGVYTKINVSNSGCTSNDEAQTLTDPSGITLTSTKTDPTSCGGTDGKITISGLTNGKSYTLSYVKDGASPTTSSITASGTTYDISSLGKGVYTKINVSNSGCTSNDEAQKLIDPSGITISSTKSDPSICGGIDGKITISGLTNGNNYSFSYIKDGTTPITSSFTSTGSTFDISNLSKGIYTKINVTESGCTSNDETQTLINPAGPVSPSAKLIQPTCEINTGTITITSPLGNYTYSTDGINFQASTLFNALPANKTYKVLVKDLGGCKDSNNFKIDTILSSPTNVNFLVKNATCTSSTGVINVTSPIGSYYMYSISGSDFQTTTSFNNLSPGNYTLTTKNLSGCSSTNSITIKSPPSPPNQPYGIAKQPDCELKTGTITVVNPVGQNYSYSLDNINYQASPIFTLKTPGNYTYYVKDTTLCFSSNTISIQAQPTLPKASFSYAPTDLTIINTQTKFTNNSSNATSYKWNFDDGSKFSNEKNPEHEFPGIANVYFVKLTAYNDLCTDDTTIAITITEKPIIYIPNSFTPNTDEINNSFVPVIAGGISPDNYSLYIFNRWGTLIFESHNKDIGWDGTYGNKICQSGTYIWKIEYKESTGSKLRKQLVGHVNLIN